MDSKKHVGFIIYSLDSGGAERVVSSLANQFVDIYKVTIITLVKSPSFYELHPNINIVYCGEDMQKSKHIFSAFMNNFKLMKTIRRYLKTLQIDLLLGFMTTSNVLGILAAKSLKIPCIISERSNPYIYTHNLFWNTLIKFTYPKADYLVVQSQLTKDYYNQYINDAKLFILPNPISGALSSHKDSLVKREKIILNVGRLDHNKAQNLLIKAFANIDHDGWRLIFVGDGVLYDDYNALVKKLNISSAVTFKGNVTNVSDYYNEASIFAFTSKSEGFPNALVEAMYFEMACISTNCPSGPSEVIVNEKNGFLIDVDNQSQLESRLKTLMNSEQLRLTFGKEAYHTVKSFEIDSVATQWNNLIKTLL